jgi:hypothetical protein
MERLRSNAPPDVHVLDNQSVVIEDVRFLGSILWTDFQLFGEIDKWFSIQRAHQCIRLNPVMACGMSSERSSKRHFRCIPND